MGKDFSDEQKEVINIKQKNVLVQAAAGSGKTTVLVEKIARMVAGIDNSPVAIDRILVMTFTNNATNEMKNRIKENIVGKIDELQKEGKDISDLEYQLSMVNNANIQTIDSFCKELIDNNFAKLEKLDPKYQIADDKELELLRYDVQTELLENKFDIDEYKDFFKLYFNKDDDKIRSMLDASLNYINGKAFPLEYLNNFKEKFDENNQKAKNDYISNVLTDMKYDIKFLVNNIIDLYEKVKKYTLVSGKGKTKTKKQIEEENRVENNIKVFGQFVEKIKKLYVNVDDDEFVKNVLDYKNCIDKIIIKDRSDKDKEFNRANIGIGASLSKEDGSNENYSNFAKAVTSFHITKTSYMPNHINILKNMNNITDEQVNNKNELLFIDLLIEYYDMYEKAKSDKKIIEIGDLQKYVLELLYKKEDGKYVYSEFAKEVADKFDYIFVDEYQDTSMIQEKIVDALSLGYTKKNVFMVGDVKQSIYRFRNADVSIFNKKYEDYEKDGVDNKLLLLSKNFRSSESVVEFVNELFADVMTKEATKIDYNNGNVLRYSRDDGDKKDIYNEIRVHYNNDLINQNIENKNKIEENFCISESALNSTVDYYLITGMNATDIKSRKSVAKKSGNEEEKKKCDNLQPRRISIKDETNLVAQIIKNLHEKEQVPYKDITILLRKEKNTFVHYLNSLQMYGIPAACTMKQGFYDSYEIQLMLDILSIIDNPYDDVKLASVLTSCIIDISNNDLAFLKKVYNESIDTEKLQYFQLEDAVQLFLNKYSKEGVIEKEEENLKKNYDVEIKELYEKLSSYNEWFSNFREMARYKSISDLINIICDKTNYRYFINNMTVGRMRVENLKLLLKKAKSYEDTSYVGLNNFMRYIEHIKEQEIDEGIADYYDENEDVVKITTIHKSKGLEYNVVILPNLSAKYNEMGYTENNKRNNLVCINDDYGISLNYVNYKKRLEYVTPKRSLVDDIEKVESISEEMRILYVALTRAREKLILVDRVSNEKNKENLFPKKYEKKNLTKKEIWNCNKYSMLMNHTINRLIRKNDSKFRFIWCDATTLPDNNNVIEEKKVIDNIDIMQDINNLSGIKIEQNVKKYDEDVLSKNVDFVDKYEKLADIKPKISVSSIKSEHMLSSNQDVWDKKNTKIDDDNHNINNFIDNIDENLYAYDIKDNDEKLDDIKSNDLGTMYHRVMELYDFSDDDVMHQLNEMIDNSLIDENAKKIIDENKIKKFLDSDLGKCMKEAQKNNLLYREKRFMKYYKKSEIDNYKNIINDGNIDDLKDENIIVQGIIDAFFISENNGKKTITLLDYKTDGLKYNNVSKQNLVDRYKVQLDIYEKALKETVGIDVEKKIIYSFTLDKIIEL